jgi:3-hydroxyacyl-CoA dehydrogenase
MGRGIDYVAAMGRCWTVLEEEVAYIYEKPSKRALRPRGWRRSRRISRWRIWSRSARSQMPVVRQTCEAVPEEMEIKLEIFTIFDKFATPYAVLTSNPSSLSITEMAPITFRPEKSSDGTWARKSLSCANLPVVKQFAPIR